MQPKSAPLQKQGQRFHPKHLVPQESLHGRCAEPSIRAHLGADYCLQAPVLTQEGDRSPFTVLGQFLGNLESGHPHPENAERCSNSHWIALVGAVEEGRSPSPLHTYVAQGRLGRPCQAARREKQQHDGQVKVLLRDTFLATSRQENFGALY
eukprot:5071598-Amphidinium_carterae.1